mmetsp:Transcript_165/g.338  ORF Transcript_165/g.338 Transcript_165/m.338 type:complete len:90 (-) Transcript_165:378-647(-)
MSESVKIHSHKPNRVVPLSLCGMSTLVRGEVALVCSGVAGVPLLFYSHKPNLLFTQAESGIHERRVKWWAIWVVATLGSNIGETQKGIV